MKIIGINDWRSCSFAGAIAHGRRDGVGGRRGRGASPTSPRGTRGMSPTRAGQAKVTQRRQRSPQTPQGPIVKKTLSFFLSKKLYPLILRIIWRYPTTKAVSLRPDQFSLPMSLLIIGFSVISLPLAVLTTRSSNSQYRSLFSLPDLRILTTGRCYH